MSNRRDMIPDPQGLESRLFHPGLTDAEAAFVAEDTDLLDDQVPPELREYPTISKKDREQDVSRAFDGYRDYFNDPYMPETVLGSINPDDSIETGLWLQRIGFQMVEGVLVHSEQQSRTVGSIALSDLNSGKGAITESLSSGVLVGPYMLTNDATSDYFTAPGIGLWISQLRRELQKTGE